MGKKITVTIELDGDCGCGGEPEVTLEPIDDHAADDHEVAEHQMIEHDPDDWDDDEQI